jgi:hypothetical protein
MAIQLGALVDEAGNPVTPRALTKEEREEWAAIDRTWDWIEVARTNSDNLELQVPIPLDYASDAHWPTVPQEPWKEKPKPKTSVPNVKEKKDEVQS